MRNPLRISFVASFLLALVIAGCSSNTTDPSSNNSSGSVTRPGVGSQFIRYNQVFDTAGHALPNLAWYDTLYVIASGISYQGKTNVVEFRIGSQPALAAVRFYNYESNGDVSFYVDGLGRAGERSVWETLPLASKGSTSFTTYDSLGGTRVDRYTYAGEQNVSEAGKSLDAFVVDYQFLTTVSGEEVGESTSYFSPALGLSVKAIDYYSNPVGVVSSSTDLVSYTLK